MTRLDRFKALENHAWLKKSYKKLSKDDLQFCFVLLQDTQNLDKNAFASKVIRLWLDKEKPKSWKNIEELLIATL